MRELSLCRPQSAAAALLALFVWAGSAFAAVTHHPAARAHAVVKTHAPTVKSKGRLSAMAATRHLAPGAGRHAPALTAEALRLHTAFVATEQLRPMAQQMASSRSAAAFSGVLGYATAHPGVGAATAYLAAGHAYALDKRYPEAVDAFRRAGGAGDALGDYAEYLRAQALLAGGQPAEVPALLNGFAARHPDSIFAETGAPMLLSSARLQAGDGAGAVRALAPLNDTPAANRADVRLAVGHAAQAAGDSGLAKRSFRAIYIEQPLAFEAKEARVQLDRLGAQPTAAERKVHADALFNAKRYIEASAEYTSLRGDSTLSAGDRDGLIIYNAVCDLKLKHLSRHQAEQLPTTNDDTAALKLYLLAEIARTEKDRTAHDAAIEQLLDHYGKSRWLEEALYSGGNMALLAHDAHEAIRHYKLLTEHFPASTYAPSAHWREAWMNYRLRQYSEAARLMDEQVIRYGAGIEAPAALYWRGRLYEEQESNFPQAVNFYRSLSANYTNFYYAYLARQRLAVIGNQAEIAPSPTLASVRKLTVPDLADAVPETDPHVVKAKLLANAALNEYIAPELAASAGSAQWSALAQAEIYASFGEMTRALQAIKRSGVPFFALSTAQVPQPYWKLLFPEPYWSDLVSDSERNGLDPYLVASLIRQESEFNAGAVSPAHAYGLMQLLASVGRENGRREGLKGVGPAQLLDPVINLRLGTRNLKAVLDRFGGQPEYALAAYNAGDVPVRQWLAQGEYRDVPEFVESIPYTETREYVQAILRNREIYRALSPATR